MPAPKKSLRPKARPKSIYGVEEMSTQSPDGMTIEEREAAARLLAKKREGLKMPSLRRKKDGGALKSVPSGNKGLSKLPTEVRNNMGYMQSGGKVKKMGMGGSMCRGMGAATRGGKFTRDG
jgi:hypothetical protein